MYWGKIYSHLNDWKNNSIYLNVTRSGLQQSVSSSLSNAMGQAQAAVDTEVTLQNIQELYRRFTTDCPSGNLHLHEFKKIFGINSRSTEEEVAFMEIVFHSFDSNKVL